MAESPRKSPLDRIPNRSSLIASIPRVGRDSLVLAPGYVVPGLVSLVLIPLLFSSLGASQYGVMALIIAVANGVPQLTTSWLEAVLVRFAHHQTFEASWRAVAGALLASGLVGALVAALFIPTPDAQVIAITTIFTGLVGAYLLVVARLQSHMRFGAITRGATVRAILGGVLAVVLGVAYHTASAAAVGLAIGFAVGTLIMLFDERRASRLASTTSIPLVRSGDSRPTGTRDVATYGAGSLAVAGSLYVLSVGDRFVLSAVRPLGDVGIYAATYGIVDLLFRLVPSVVFVAVRPQIFRSWDRGERSNALSLVTLVACMLGWLLAALSIVLLSVATVTVRLPIDRLLAGPITVGLAAFVAANTFGLLYGAQMRQGRLGLNLTIAATLNIALNLAFDPSLGAYGAALATFIGYTSLLALNLWGLRTIRDAQPRLMLAILTVCLASIAANGLVAGTPVWPIGAVASAASLLATAPLIFGLVRAFPWPSEPVGGATDGEASGRASEEGQLA